MRQLLFSIPTIFSLSLAAQERGAMPVLSPQSAVTGLTRAVVVGISDYQDDKIPDLSFADRDALAFAQFLRSRSGGSLTEDQLKLLTNEQAGGTPKDKLAAVFPDKLAKIKESNQEARFKKLQNPLP